MQIIALDIGTSRIKATAFDEYGNMKQLCSCRLDRAASPETQDAEAWAEVSFRLLKEVSSQLSVPADAVVLTGNMHALLGVDEAGKPVADAILWSDNSAAAEAEELDKNYGQAIIGFSGNRVIPVFTLPKILKMQRSAPGLYRKTATFMQSKDFVIFRLTGERVTDPSDASGVLALDLASGRWQEDFLAETGIDKNKLPRIVPSSAVCGYVTPAAARATGLATGTPVITGAGDLATAAIGSAVDDHTFSLTLGTAGQLLGTGEKGCGKKLAEKLFVFAHADPERELYLGSVPAGGFSFEWFAKMHRLTMPEFFELASQAELSAALPVHLPYILGKGAPFMDYIPCGAIFGVSARHTVGELALATVCGTLCALRQCADLLEELAGKRQNLLLQALACRESAVRDAACAIFKQDKFLPENSEASLAGAAVIAAAGLGAYADINSAAAAMLQKKTAPGKHLPEAEKLFERYLRFSELV